MRKIINHSLSVIKIDTKEDERGAINVTVEVNGKAFSEGQPCKAELKDWISDQVTVAKARIDSDEVAALSVTELLRGMGFRD